MEKEINTKRDDHISERTIDSTNKNGLIKEMTTSRINRNGPIREIRANSINKEDRTEISTSKGSSKSLVSVGSVNKGLHSKAVNTQEVVHGTSKGKVEVLITTKIKVPITLRTIGQINSTKNTRSQPVNNNKYWQAWIPVANRAVHKDYHGMANTQAKLNKETLRDQDRKPPEGKAPLLAAITRNPAALMINLTALTRNPRLNNSPKASWDSSRNFRKYQGYSKQNLPPRRMSGIEPNRTRRPQKKEREEELKKIEEIKHRLE